MSNTPSCDVMVIGAGAIGLSLAWELARRGVSTALVERENGSRAASWAAAGMIPDGPDADHWSDASPLERLAGLSRDLHRLWHEHLKEATGVDNEYQRRGAIHLAHSDLDAAELEQALARAMRLGMRAERLEARDLEQLEPTIARGVGRWRGAVCFADEGQLRPPRHLRALEQACLQAGVQIHRQTAVHNVRVERDRVVGIDAGQGVLTAHSYCLTMGCWTENFLAAARLQLATRPIRGQIALLEGRSGILGRHVCVGRRYIVPRRDGLTLVGSTEEDAGFDPSTTPEAIAELQQFAVDCVPALATASLRQAWAGLRPSAHDGLPTLGRCGSFENLWVAVGHYRGGVQLGPATASVMADLMTGVEPPFDVSPFGWRS